MRLKIIILLVIGSLAVFSATSLIERMVVAPEFVALELNEAERDLRRVEHALGAELEQLLLSARNYGEWDDACDFIQTQNPAFIRSNLPSEIFVALKVDVIEYYDRAGKLIWSGTRNTVESKSGKKQDEMVPPFTSSREFLAHLDAPPSGKSGFTVAGDKLLLVASYPVVSSSGAGPIRGTVIFARMLSRPDEKRLRMQTDVPFSLLSPDGQRVSREVHQRLARGEDVFSEERSGILRAWAYLKDMQGKPLRLIQVDFSREISAQGLAAVRDDRLWTVIAIMVLMAMIYLAIRQTVIRPVQRLIEHVHWIRQSGDLGSRIGRHTQDEVGALAAEFDLLLTQLAHAHAARVRSEKRLSALVQEQRDTIRRLSENNREGLDEGGADEGVRSEGLPGT